jgi:hypothetical protein
MERSTGEPLFLCREKFVPPSREDFQGKWMVKLIITEHVLYLQEHFNMISSYCSLLGYGIVFFLFVGNIVLEENSKLNQSRQIIKPLV